MEYRAGEFAADRIIHMMGTLAGVAGSAILVGIAAAVAVLPTFSASLVYSVCLVAMLGCSAAYNLSSNASRREFLHRLDHAAIFLMIAGTYTPFTTCRLQWRLGDRNDNRGLDWRKLICPRRVKTMAETSPTHRIVFNDRNHQLEEIDKKLIREAAEQFVIDLIAGSNFH
jgi:hypothetical protein